MASIVVVALTFASLRAVGELPGSISMGNFRCPALALHVAQSHSADILGACTLRSIEAVHMLAGVKTRGEKCSVRSSRHHCSVHVFVC